MDSISMDFGYWVKDHRIKGLTGNGTEDFYVSEDDLRGYWDEARVGNVLIRARMYRFPPKSIIQNYIRIFSILVYIATPNLPSLAYLSEFTKKGSDDHILPFTEDSFPGTLEGKEVETKFLQSQFLFSPVVLGSGLHGRDLHSRCVLPLTLIRQLSGHFGSPANTVTTKLYKLHKASKLKAKEDLIVIKEYPKSEIEHSFKNKLNAYLSFHYPGNEDDVFKYFIKYHGSFKQKDKGIIILEFADEGTLLDLYKSNRVPRTREELLGFFENLSGLLRGLMLLHARDLRRTNRQLRGVHLDLNPANILVFRNEDDGTSKYNFKIGDFGLTSFPLDEAYDIKMRDNKGGIMYNAPEMTNYDIFSRSFDEGISHLVDIWSFGCVLFEAAVWAISDDRGREEFRNLRREENSYNNLLRNQGYWASFHNGDRRLDAVDKTLERAIEKRHVFDDLTEGFCELVLKHAMVPVRKPRYDAKKLGAVINQYFEEKAKTPQTSWQAPSPTYKISIPELDRRANPRSFDYARMPPDYNTFPMRSTSGGNQSGQRESHRHYSINGPRDSDSPHFLPEETSLAPRRESELHPLLTPPVHRDPFPSTGNENTAVSEPHVAKPTISPPISQTRYLKFRVPHVINWIQGGKKESDELYRYLSVALGKMKQRQKIFIIDDTASMKKNHWPAVVDTFRALAHLTDEVDPDGIDLYFRSSPESTKKLQVPKLLNKFRAVERLVDKVISQGMKQEDIIFDMEDSISKILDQVKEKISRKNPKTSIYILTDGIWDDATNSDNICGVDNAIRSLVGEMRRQNQMRSNISIQFIRFGDSEVAKARLRYLDDDLAKDFKSYNIVDTTSDRSPVWKMLLGSIIGIVDNATDDYTEDVEQHILSSTSDKVDDVKEDSEGVDDYFDRNNSISETELSKRTETVVSAISERSSQLYKPSFPRSHTGSSEKARSQGNLLSDAALADPVLLEASIPDNSIFSTYKPPDYGESESIHVVTSSESVEEQMVDTTQTSRITNNHVEELSLEYKEPHRVTRWSSWWLWLMGICFPPPTGYQRISYICGCGEHSYVDVRELTPGGTERFRQRLVNSVAAVKYRPQNSPTNSNELAHLPEAHLRVNTVGAEPRLPESLRQISSDSRYNEVHGSAPNSDNPYALIHQQYLLVCVNTRNSTKLVQIDVTSIGNDQLLFQSISSEYKSARREHEWRIALLIPHLARKSLYAISQWLPNLPFSLSYLSNFRGFLDEMHLHRIASGDFVRFQLIPIGQDSCPDWFKIRDLPPEAEVTEGRYLYEPVPMKDVELLHIPLSHLLKPGPHTDRFWRMRFPKKLREELVRRPGAEGQSVVGWGIRINETLNWSQIFLIILVSLFVIGLISAIYAVVTSDSNSAFALGSFLSALFGLYFGYQYLAWKEQP